MCGAENRVRESGPQQGPGGRIYGSGCGQRLRKGVRADGDVLRDRDVERWIDRRSTRAAGNDLRRPAKDLFKECPGIVQFE